MYKFYNKSIYPIVVRYVFFLRFIGLGSKFSARHLDDLLSETSRHGRRNYTYPISLGVIKHALLDKPLHV